MNRVSSFFKQLRQRKTFPLLLLLACAIFILFLLAASLRQMKFLPGQEFSLAEQMPSAAGSGGDLLARLFILILRGVIALAIVIFPIYLIIALFSKEGRRWLLRNLAIFGVMLAVLLLVQDQLGAAVETIFESLENITGLEPPQMEPSGPEMTFQASPPDWVSLVASLAIGLLIAAVVGLAIWFVWKMRTRPPSALESLEDEARLAIDAIQSGGDLKDVIVQCYRKMTAVVQAARGIERHQSMTAEEFQQLLIERGLPQTAVIRLTRLFEDVRYGGITFSTEENQQAIDSLNDIINACRALRGETP